MDAFIIYKVAMEEPLNLNSIILKEMANVRNHNTQALSFCALLTKIFKHFHVSVRDQRNQGLDKGFSLNTIKKGKKFSSSEEKMEDEDVHDMDVPLQIEGA